MTIKAGDTMPAGVLTHMTKDGPQKITTNQLFGGKKVVLFSVPGAFTPTCDAKHLPGFVQQADALKGKGIDTIACMVSRTSGAAANCLASEPAAEMPPPIVSHASTIVS